MIYRHLSNLLLVLAAILFGVAGYGYYLDTDTHGARIENAEREFPDLKVGVNTVTYRLNNPTRHPVRVVGCSFC